MALVSGPTPACGTDLSLYFPSQFLFISLALIQRDWKTLSLALHLIKLISGKPDCQLGAADKPVCQGCRPRFRDADIYKLKVEEAGEEGGRHRQGRVRAESQTRVGNEG